MDIGQGMTPKGSLTSHSSVNSRASRRTVTFSIASSSVDSLTRSITKEQTSRRSSHSSRSSKQSGHKAGPQDTNEINVDNVDDNTLEDQLTLAKLQELEKIFEEADEDGDPGLDMGEFRNAMRSTMGNIPDHEMDMIFMKVDTNCDGTVDWEEYLSYMLLECREKDVMGIEAGKIFPEFATILETDHKDQIVRMQFFNASRARVWEPTRMSVTEQDAAMKSDIAYGRYASASFEGIICLWTTTYDHIRSYKPESEYCKYVYVTDIIVVPKYEMLLVATTNCTLMVYTIHEDKFDPINEILKTPECLVYLSYYTHPDNHVGMAFGGTDRGSIVTLRWQVNPLNTIINSKSMVNILKPKEDLYFRDIYSGVHKDLEAFFIQRVHVDMLKQIVYLPHSNQFLSCCHNAETSMCISDFPRATNPLYFSVPGGVNSCDFSKELNVLVSGGFDSFIRIWNPVITSKPVIMLSGHQNPIVSIIIIKAKEHVISVDDVREVRLYDLNTQTCLQILDRNIFIELGQRNVSATEFNPQLQSLLIANDRVAIVDRGEGWHEMKYLMSHDREVCFVKFNPLFNLVVSASWDSLICVWEFATGKKVMQFKAHIIIRHGVAYEYEVTALCFDPTFRRLVTCGRDGLVKIWNFNNGGLLRSFPTFSKQDMTCILFCRKKIIVGGWSRRLTLYVDDEDDDSVQWLFPYHMEDITSIVYHESTQTLVSSAYNGDIYLWSATSGRVTACYNHRLSNRQLPPYQYTGYEKIKRTSILMAKLALLRGEEENLRKPAFGSNFGKRREPDDDDDDSPRRRLRPATPLAVRKAYKYRFKMKGGAPNQPKIPTLFPIPKKRHDLPERRSIVQKLGELDQKRRDLEDTSTASSLADKCRMSGLGAVVRLVMLNKRMISHGTANMFAACADGYVRGWSVHNQGGLIGIFYAGEHRDQIGLTEMAVSVDNTELVTGDSCGYVKIWNVEHYLIKDAKCTAECETRWNDWIFFKLKKALSRAGELKRLRPYFPEPRNLHLLTSFRGHLQPITSIDHVCLGQRNFVITGSLDMSVRMWTTEGLFVGIFGQSHLWTIQSITMPVWREGEIIEYGEDTLKLKEGHQVVPADLVKGCTMVSLFVLRKGYYVNWRRCFHHARLFLIRKRAEDIMNAELELARIQHRLDGKLKGMFHDSDPSIPILGKYFRKEYHHRPYPMFKMPIAHKSQFPAFRLLPVMPYERAPHPMSIQSIQQIQYNCHLPPLEVNKGIGRLFQKMVFVSILKEQDKERDKERQAKQVVAAGTCAQKRALAAQKAAAPMSFATASATTNVQLSVHKMRQGIVNFKRRIPYLDSWNMMPDDPESDTDSRTVEVTGSLLDPGNNYKSKNTRKKIKYKYNKKELLEKIERDEREYGDDSVLSTSNSPTVSDCDLSEASTTTTTIRSTRSTESSRRRRKQNLRVPAETQAQVNSKPANSKMSSAGQPSTAALENSGKGKQGSPKRDLNKNNNRFTEIAMIPMEQVRDKLNTKEEPLGVWLPQCTVNSKVVMTSDQTNQTFNSNQSCAQQCWLNSQIQPEISVASSELAKKRYNFSLFTGLPLSNQNNQQRVTTMRRPTTVHTQRSKTSLGTESVKISQSQVGIHGEKPNNGNVKLIKVQDTISLPSIEDRKVVAYAKNK